MICQACGLCCDGTLFGHVAVKPEDSTERLIGLGLAVGPSEETGGLTFPQPCSAFHGNCGVYGDRPSVCRGFRCPLLRRFEAGKIPEGDALRIIADTRTSRDTLADLMGEAGMARARTAAVLLSPDTDEAKKRVALTLMFLLDRYFYTAQPQ